VSLLELLNITYQGEPIDDFDILDSLPPALASLLQQINGFIQFNGGFHLRGACWQPEWHSLRTAWFGDRAFHRLYSQVMPEDIPFAEDCMGDQFLLRGETLYHLSGETGELTVLEWSFRQFIQEIQTNPVEVLSLQPLLQFQQKGEILQPGYLLAAYPPFCTKESANGVSLSAVSSRNRYQFLADFASQIQKLSE
jgi:hypothetical protein